MGLIFNSAYIHGTWKSAVKIVPMLSAGKPSKHGSRNRNLIPGKERYIPPVQSIGTSSGTHVQPPNQWVLEPLSLW